MIEVKIGAAAHSLNANQRRLLELLRDGKTPYECSRIMGIGLQYSGGAYPPPCNIMDMISEIRVAGYDVPTYAHDRLVRTFAEISQNTKEDNTMYTNHSVEVKEQARQLREQGLSAAKIGESLGVPCGTVKKWVYGDTAKEKPVSESTDTGKEEKEVLTEDKPVEGIVTQAAEKVKYTFSEITIQAMADAISDFMDDIARLSEQVDDAMMHLTKKQVELEEKQAQLLTEIGTSNFNWHYKSALDEQEHDKKMQPLYEWLDTWAECIKSYNYDGTKTFVRAYTQGAAQEMPSGYDAGKKYYYTKGYSATVYAEYSEPVVSEEEKQRRAEEQRKTEELNERRSKLNNICRRMTKSRVEFWRDFERLPGKSAANKLAALSQIADIVARYNADSPYGSCDTEDFIEYIFNDVSDFDMQEELSDWIKKQFADMHAEKRIIFNMMNGMDIGDKNTYDWNCRYDPDMAASLVAEYEIMIICGYEMSDEELAMLGGSHELYAEGGEDNA